MPVVTLNWESAHLHGRAWISHHRLRYRIFVERRGWRLSAHHGLEWDEYDNPRATYVLWVDEGGEVQATASLDWI